MLHFRTIVILNLMRAVRENRDCDSAVRVRYQEVKDLFQSN